MGGHQSGGCVSSELLNEFLGVLKQQYMNEDRALLFDESSIGAHAGSILMKCSLRIGQI